MLPSTYEGYVIDMPLGPIVLINLIYKNMNNPKDALVIEDGSVN